MSEQPERPAHWRGRMRVLITGGAGFVGCHLAEALLARGDTVHVIDDLSTGSIENIEALKEDRRFHYVIDSVMNERVLAELIDRVDVVFHLAAAVGVRLIVESPVNTIETNVHGTEIVLKLANKKKKKVLLASTSEVYGKSNDVPFHEESDLVMGATHKGRWSYACSKALDEFLALAYHKEKRLPVVIVRLFNTVGPRQTGRYGMVIPNFVKQALLGHPITVYGDGSQSRCFTYVGDVVGALISPGRARGRRRAGLQRRQRRARDLDPRARPEGQGAHAVAERDQDRALRPGVRGGLRGHAPPGAGPREDPRAHRLPAEGGARRDPRPRDRVLHVGPGPELVASFVAQVRRLAGQSALYGLADVLPNVAQPAARPALHARSCRPRTTATLALLALFSTLAKIVFRLGLDAGFFRVHYDQPDEAEPAAPGRHRRALRRRWSGAALLARRRCCARPAVARRSSATSRRPRAGWSWPRPTWPWAPSPSCR